MNQQSENQFDVSKYTVESEDYFEDYKDVCDQNPDMYSDIDVSSDQLDIQSQTEVKKMVYNFSNKSLVTSGTRSGKTQIMVISGGDQTSSESQISSLIGGGNQQARSQTKLNRQEPPMPAITEQFYETNASRHQDPVMYYKMNDVQFKETAQSIPIMERPRNISGSQVIISELKQALEDKDAEIHNLRNELYDLKKDLSTDAKALRESQQFKARQFNDLKRVMNNQLNLIQQQKTLLDEKDQKIQILTTTNQEFNASIAVKDQQLQLTYAQLSQLQKQLQQITFAAETFKKLSLCIFNHYKKFRDQNQRTVFQNTDEIKELDVLTKLAYKFRNYQTKDNTKQLADALKRWKPKEKLLMQDETQNDTGTLFTMHRTSIQSSQLRGLLTDRTHHHAKSYSSLID